MQGKMAGELVVEWVQSKVLNGNPLGDPTERRLFTYLPPGYTDAPQKKYPALLALAGFTGTGSSFFNLDPLAEDLKSKADRLILSGHCPPVIIVAPDCFTKLGGNQYINSSATGRYEDYLLDEILPFAEKKYRIHRWGVFGKSSGGYGSMLLGMRHPERFEVLGDHSGDSNFELCYLPDMPKALNAMARAGGPAPWLEKFWSDVNHKRREYHDALNIIAMAAHYSPNPDSPTLGIDFPFDLSTGRFRPSVWEKWRGWDPVNLVEKYRANLKKLKFIYLDCGSRDEFGLHWGARALKKEFERNGIPLHYDEFEDGHMSVSYRYDQSLPLLVRALGY